MYASLHDKQNQGARLAQPNKKQRKSLEVEEMQKKYCFIKEAETQMENAEPKVQRIVDECPPPHNASHCETNYHIGEQAFIPVSLQNIKNTLEQRIKHKFLL